MSSLSAAELHQLRAACLKGDLRAAERALRHSSGLGCLAACATAGGDEAAAGALLAVFEEDGSNTLLHYLCQGEPLGLVGGAALSLARLGSRAHSGGAAWPARHPKGRAQLLAALIARQPRLALLAGRRNAALDTPLHLAVQSASWRVLAVLLAALQQLLSAATAQQSHPAMLEAAGMTLQLLLSVPNSAGLAPLELALHQRQWPAVQLLAAAAHGAPPLSQAQAEASALVQHYLASGGRGCGAAASGVQVSARGATVAEALGGLLAKVWDTWATGQDQRDAAAAGSGSSSAGGGSGGLRSLQCSGPLQLRALAQADVLALVRQEAQEALAAAAFEAADAGGVSGGGRASDQQGAAQDSRDAPGTADAPYSPAAAAADAASSAGPPPASSPEAGACQATPTPTATATATAPCIVCYEDCQPRQLALQLPCGHVTCNACWRGILLASIDEGDPRRAMCPEPGCAAPLPLPAAARLLGAASLQRYHQLLTQRYLATHQQRMRSCPQPSCTAMLHLPPPTAAQAATGAAGKAAADAARVAAAAGAAAAAAAAAPGAGLDAECGACGHRFCWRCSEEAHEPASCDQVHKWGEELAALRRAAPDADRQWLSSNTKRCPQCRAHIQKHGGCNHMHCGSCGHHFCWVCGQDWRQHSTETGGFYFCSLEQRSDLPEYSAGSNTGGAGGAGLGGPLAWLAGVWSGIRAAAQQQQLQRYLRQYLRLSGGGAALQTAAQHMQLLLAAVGAAQGGGSLGRSTAAGPQKGPSPEHQPAAACGPELLGVTAAEARRMGLREWGDLVTAAAASAADAAPLPTTLAAPGVLAAAASISGGSSSSSSDGEAGAAYLAELAEAVTAARSLLQHATVALYQLPGGEARRRLQRLARAMQARLEQLEPLLLALPEREVLPPAAAHHEQRWGLSPAQPAQQQVQQTAAARGPAGGSGGGGLIAWLLERWYGLEVAPSPAGAAAGPGALTPEAQAALAGLSDEALLQQAQFAAAVHQRRTEVQAVTAALREGMQEMRAAARAGQLA